jgi:phosphatidate cytidylyltransferase
VADEHGGEKEDLFEDLDKFFAPIQDVEWPGEEAPARPEEPAVTQASREHAETPEPEGAGSEGGGDVGMGGRFADEGGDEPWSEAPSREIEQGTKEVGEEPAWYEVEPSELAARETQELELTTDALRAAPTEYRDLPSDEAPADNVEEPPIEGSPWVAEEAPSTEAVEAAAAHFADSMRQEEAGVEAAFGGPTPRDDAGLAGETFSPEDLPGGPADVESELLADLEEEGRAQRTVRLGEGLGGPSWQEPTSVEVGLDQERGRGERDVPAAVLTGVALAVVAVGALLIGTGAFALVAGAIVLLALGEFYGVLHKHHQQPATLVGLASGFLILWGAYSKGAEAALAMAALGTIASLVWFIATPEPHRKHVVVNAGLTVFGIAWIPVLAAFLVAMLKGVPDGESVVLTVIVTTLAYDTGAFVIGWVSGGTWFPPLAPTVSPKKTWEGLVGGLGFSLLAAIVLAPMLIRPFNGKLAWSLGLGLVVALAATLGDLAESLIKRDLGIKDMGNILPGHGGVLDRIDSLLFVAPAVFLYLRLVLL